MQRRGNISGEVHSRLRHVIFVYEISGKDCMTVRNLMCCQARAQTVGRFKLDAYAANTGLRGSWYAGISGWHVMKHYTF